MKREPIPARACQDVASSEVVEALHDVVEVLSILLTTFRDTSDRAKVYGAMQQLVDVALTHDQLGGYQVYPAIDAEEAAENSTEEARA